MGAMKPHKEPIDIGKVLKEIPIFLVMGLLELIPLFLYGGVILFLVVLFVSGLVYLISMVPLIVIPLAILFVVLYSVGRNRKAYRHWMESKGLGFFTAPD